ncbi:hypothetical protein JB92DRAFT_3127898 [Gautieria morchelliformis]|nr:hypothetical protein JB92DRAFT_3127898 [Gautieria morchelliformis]
MSRRKRPRTVSDRDPATNEGNILAPAQVGSSKEVGVISVAVGAGEGSREAMRGDLHQTDLLDIAEDGDDSANMDAPGDIHETHGRRDGSRENDAQALEAVTPVTHEASSSSTVPEAAATAEGRPRRVRRMPARYSDILPRPPPAVPPCNKAMSWRLRDLAGLTLPNSTLTTGAGLDTGWEGLEDARHAPEVTYGPFPNASTFILSNWYYNSPSGERSDPDFN